MSTHGPSFIWDTVTPFTSGFVWDTVVGLGLMAQDIPSTGTDGAPPWYTALSLPADNGSEIRIVVESGATLGALVLDGAGGFSYSGPADSFTWQGYQDGPAMGSAVVSLLGAGTVTGVVVSPSTATGSQTFVATVTGTGSPSQVVSWGVVGGGSITSGGVFTAPAPTGSIQTIIVTATSEQDASRSGTATVTIAATDSGGGGGEPLPEFVITYYQGKFRRSAV